jgi:hypothetical protein
MYSIYNYIQFLHVEQPIPCKIIEQKVLHNYKRLYT